MNKGLFRRIWAALTVLLLLCTPTGTFSEETAPTEAPPTAAPTEEPTRAPTPAPTPPPTAEPTAEPTPAPTEEPTAEPTEEPTEEPTQEPTASPTPAPTEAATPEPTAPPTAEPTPENSKLVMKGKSRRRSNLKLESLAYPEDGLRVPLLFQFDYTTVIATKGEKKISVSSSGCGATALSMAIAYMTGDTVQTPYTIMYAAVKDRLYRVNKGLGHSAMSKLARRHGLNARWIGANEEAIRAELEAGRPVIAHMGEGRFTAEGHYILLRGFDEDGRVYVTDPNSRENSGKTYALRTIFEESKTSTPFMLLSIPTPEETPTPAPTPEGIKPAGKEAE